MKGNSLIIIIEDEADTAEMFAEMMRLGGYNVQKVFGGTAAIDLLSHLRPDVVLLDLMMPDVSGLEVLKYMRREPGLENIPVIIVSARGMPDDIRLGMDAGATSYLTKPVGFAELRQAVEQALNSTRTGDASIG